MLPHCPRLQLLGANFAGYSHSKVDIHNGSGSLLEVEVTDTAIKVARGYELSRHEKWQSTKLSQENKWSIL